MVNIMPSSLSEIESAEVQRKNCSASEGMQQ